jgi:hypothetical protein
MNTLTRVNSNYPNKNEAYLVSAKRNNGSLKKPDLLQSYSIITTIEICKIKILESPKLTNSLWVNDYNNVIKPSLQMSLIAYSNNLLKKTTPLIGKELEVLNSTFNRLISSEPTKM